MLADAFREAPVDTELRRPMRSLTSNLVGAMGGSE